jgi:hypothetical protein
MVKTAFRSQITKIHSLLIPRNKLFLLQHSYKNVTHYGKNYK